MITNTLSLKAVLRQILLISRFMIKFVLCTIIAKPGTEGKE